MLRVVTEHLAVFLGHTCSGVIIRPTPPFVVVYDGRPLILAFVALSVDLALGEVG